MYSFESHEDGSFSHTVSSRIGYNTQKTSTAFIHEDGSVSCTISCGQAFDDSDKREDVHSVDCTTCPTVIDRNHAQEQRQDGSVCGVYFDGKNVFTGSSSSDPSINDIDKWADNSYNKW